MSKVFQDKAVHIVRVISNTLVVFSLSHKLVQIRVKSTIKSVQFIVVRLGGVEVTGGETFFLEAGPCGIGIGEFGVGVLGYWGIRVLGNWVIWYLIRQYSSLAHYLNTLYPNTNKKPRL